MASQNKLFAVCLIIKLSGLSNLNLLNKYFSSYWVRSAFYSFLQRFSVTLFGVANFMLLVRYLSKSQMGVWALFLIVITTFELSKSALLKSAHIRYVSASLDPTEKTTIASSSLVINGFLNLLFILLLLLFSDRLSGWLNAGTDLSTMLKWFIPGMISMIFFSHFEAVQQSHFDFKGVFAGYLTRQVVFFIIIFTHFILKIPFVLSHLAMYQTISIILGTLMLYFHSRKYLLFRFDPTLIWIKKIIGYGGYIFGSGIISNFFANLDQLITSMFMSTSSVAYYNTATRISGFVDTPSYAATEILFPKLSQASAVEGVVKVKYLYERMVSILLSLITPVAIFIIIFPKLIIVLLAGAQYKTAAPILQLYMLNCILGTLQNQSANTLNSIGKSALCFVLNAISLITKMLITYICLVNFGFYGAAIGALITSLLTVFLWYYVIKKQIGATFSNVIKYVIEFYTNMYTRLTKFLFKTKPIS